MNISKTRKAVNKMMEGKVRLSVFIDKLKDGRSSLKVGRGASDGWTKEEYLECAQLLENDGCEVVLKSVKNTFRLVVKEG